VHCDFVLYYAEKQLAAEVDCIVKDSLLDIVKREAIDTTIQL
jgi:hypothetical protein